MCQRAPGSEAQPQNAGSFGMFFFFKYFMCYDVYLSSNIPMKCAIDSILYISLYTLYVDITEGFHLRHV